MQIYNMHSSCMCDICTFHANQVKLCCTPQFQCHNLFNVLVLRMRVYIADLPYRCATFALSRIGRGPKGGETAVRREMGLWSNHDAKRVSCLHLLQMIQWPDFFQINPGLAIQIQIVSITWDVKITFPSLDVCLNKVTSFIGCFHFFWEAFGSDEREAAGRMRRESLIGILCCTSEDMRHIFLVGTYLSLES